MPGFLEMDAEGTDTFLGRLAGTAADLRAAWADAAGLIGAGETGIGSDRLAAAFSASYRTSADPVRAATDELPGHYDGMCAAGWSCVSDYLAADQRATAAFRQGLA